MACSLIVYAVESSGRHDAGEGWVIVSLCSRSRPGPILSRSPGCCAYGLWPLRGPCSSALPPPSPPPSHRRQGCKKGELT